MTDAQIRALVAQAKADVMQELRNVIAYSQVTRTTAAGLDDGDAAAAPTIESYDNSVRRMQHAGFRSRPPVGARTLAVHPQGRATNAITVAEDVPGAGPSDLAEGETAVFGTGTAAAVIRLDEEGNAAIDAAATKDINANGGGAKVATDTTPTDNGTFAATAATNTLTLVFTPPGGAAVPIGTYVFTIVGPNILITPGGATFAAMTGKVNGGSLHFFAPAP